MDKGWLPYLPGPIRKRLENRHELQRALDNTGWLFADKILRMGLGLLVGVWVARYLGPSQFGLLSYAGSFVTLFSAVALLGLDAVIVRELVRDREHQPQLLGTAFALRFAAGLLSYGASLAVIFLLRPAEPTTHILVAIAGGLLLLQALDVIDLWFQSEVNSRYVVLAKNGAFLCSAVVKVALILAAAPLVAFAVANLLELVLGAGGLLLVYRLKGRSPFQWHICRETFGKLAREGLPLVFSSMVFMVYLRIDQVMLGQMSGDHEVGIYSAAVRVAEIWYFIPTAVVSSVFPNIVKTREADEQEFYRRLQRLYNLLVFMGYAVAIPMTVLSGFVVDLLFGTPFSPAGPMLALLVWAGVFANLVVARNIFLLAMGWSRLHLIVTALGAIANVALNLVLIPRYGGMGAVVATCISYWLAAHGGSYLFAPLRPTGRMISRALLWPKFW